MPAPAFTSLSEAAGWFEAWLREGALLVVVGAGVDEARGGFHEALTPDGRPDAASLRISDFRGGSPGAAQQAFDVARRAILICGGNGFDLPASKYGRWRDVEVTFRPDGVVF